MDEYNLNGKICLFYSFVNHNIFMGLRAYKAGGHRP